MSGSVGQYIVAAPAWQAYKSSVGLPARSNSGTYLSMGYLSVPNAQNNEAVWGGIWFDSVTWKFCSIHQVGTSYGIAHVQHDGADVTTVDHYAASEATNVYAEVTGLTVAVAGVKDFGQKAATKNASSSGFALIHQSWAWIRTGGTPSTPSGTDTPGYTWEWIPWMGVKGSTGTWDRPQSSTYFAGGAFRNNTTQAQNDEIDTDMWADTGTFKISEMALKYSMFGIATYRFDAVDLGTIDWYGAGVDNQFVEITGIANATAGVKNFKKISVSKNASSSAYRIDSQSIKVIRTGP